MQKLEQIYEGKAKKVFKTDDPELLIVDYKDDATAFNGLKKGTILGKGVINNQMTNRLMAKMEKAGIPTHFVKELSQRETLVKRVSIVPLEVIVRNISAGSFAKRYGVEEGIVFDQPTIEFSYKNDALGDPLLNTYHALALKLATAEEIETIKNYAFAVNEVLKAFWAECGVTLVDFKLEFGKVADGSIVLADEISPDTCRLWDAKTHEKLDKDRFRRDLGGVQRLASVTEKIVPVMAAIFLLGGLIVLIFRIQYLPATIGMIFKYAFEPQAIVGGSFGYAIKQAISQGAKRGLFSNEAGMGSTPHAHAQANVKDPHEQGVVAMIGVFIDTFVVLTLNALVIICTLYTADGPLANGYVGDVTSVLSKTNLAQTAFGSVMGASLGAKFVAICLFFFAFSTVLSWNLFGKINAIWLFGKKNPKACTVIYTLIALVFILMGTMMSNDLVWELTDMFNNLMVIPNVIALFALSKMVVSSAESKIAQ